MKGLSYRISKAGSLKNLKLVEEDLPEINDNEVCVKIKAIGINFADVFTIMGLYRAAPKFNFIPGLEFSGVIIKKGRDVSEFQVNDRVIGVIRFGAFTTHIIIDRQHLIKLPSEWTFEQGAGFVVQALTAYYGLVHLGNISNNQTVLIHSAAGGVGLYANRIAKSYSAFTIGTVGNASKTGLLKSEGYNEIIVRNRNFKKELKNKLNGRALDIIIETVGGRIQKDSFNLLAPTGRMIAIGVSGYASHGNRPNYLKLLFQYITRPVYDTLTLIESNKSILGFNLIWLYDRVELLQNMLVKIGKLNLGKPYIGSVYKFEKLIEAVRTFQSGRTTGKVIVKIE